MINYKETKVGIYVILKIIKASENIYLFNTTNYYNNRKGDNEGTVLIFWGIFIVKMNQLHSHYNKQ